MSKPQTSNKNIVLGIIAIVVAIIAHFASIPTGSYLAWLIPQVGLVIFGLIRIFKS